MRQGPEMLADGRAAWPCSSGRPCGATCMGNRGDACGCCTCMHPCEAHHWYNASSLAAGSKFLGSSLRCALVGAAAVVASAAAALAAAAAARRRCCCCRCRAGSPVGRPHTAFPSWLPVARRRGAAEPSSWRRAALGSRACDIGAFLQTAESMELSSSLPLISAGGGANRPEPAARPGRGAGRLRDVTKTVHK